MVLPKSWILRVIDSLAQLFKSQNEISESQTKIFKGQTYLVNVDR